MSNIPVSVQLWSVRDHVAKDFAATVAALAKMGYQGVETAGYGNLDAAGAAAALKAARLRCSGMHVGIDALRGNLTQLVVEARLLGAKDLICPWMPKELFTTAAGAIEIGRELAAIGARLHGYGLHLSYHNHDGEMTLTEGQTTFEHLLDAAPAAHLGAELDVYWAKFAGLDPARLLRRLGARCRLVHLKDKQELGTGFVDFAPIFAAIDAIGAAQWQVVEVENYNHDPLESVRRSLEQLRKWRRLGSPTTSAPAAREPVIRVAGYKTKMVRAKTA
jgi:sugar phosphate isomerase/epimerase